MSGFSRNPFEHHEVRSLVDRERNEELRRKTLKLKLHSELRDKFGEAEAARIMLQVEKKAQPLSAEAQQAMDILTNPNCSAIPDTDTDTRAKFQTLADKNRELEKDFMETISGTKAIKAKAGR